jgi:hypothetical protein
MKELPWFIRLAGPYGLYDKGHEKYITLDEAGETFNLCDHVYVTFAMWLEDNNIRII